MKNDPYLDNYLGVIEEYDREWEAKPSFIPCPTSGIGMGKFTLRFINCFTHFKNIQLTEVSTDEMEDIVSDLEEAHKKFDNQISQLDSLMFAEIERAEDKKEKNRIKSKYSARKKALKKRFGEMLREYKNQNHLVELKSEPSEYYKWGIEVEGAGIIDKLEQADDGTVIIRFKSNDLFYLELNPHTFVKLYSTKIGPYIADEVMQEVFRQCAEHLGDSAPYMPITYEFMSSIIGCEPKQENRIAFDWTICNFLSGQNFGIQFRDAYYHGRVSVICERFNIENLEVEVQDRKRGRRYMEHCKYVLGVNSQIWRYPFMADWGYREGLVYYTKDIRDKVYRLICGAFHPCENGEEAK